MAKWRLLAVVAAPLLAAAGCGSDYTDKGWAPHRPLGSDLAAYHAPVATPAAPASVVEPAGVVTLRQALAAALLHNAELTSFSYSVRAAEAGVLQASLPPNPELGVEVENFGGSGDVSGFGVAETTVSLSQVIELGGKRARRTAAAKLTTDLAAWDYEAKRIDVLTEVAQRFIDVVAGQRRLELARQEAALADQVARTVGERVKAGKVPPLEETKSRVSLASSRVAVDRSRRQLLTARQRLAAMWGSPEARFDSVHGDIEAITAIPTKESLLARTHQNPDLARWATEIALRQAEWSVAKSKAVPDVTVGAGVRHYGETADLGAVAGVSMAIPIFDRNQGDIRKSRFELARALSDHQAAEVRVRTSLEEAYQNLSAAYESAVTLKAEVLPGAEEAFSIGSRSYTEGKLSYIDVVDAQRTLHEARAQYTDALVEYHKAVADVERLIGERLGGQSIKVIEEPKATTQETATRKSQEQ